MTKTNSSVPYNSPHSVASQAIRDYVLSLENYVEYTSNPIKSFVRIARKKAKTSILDSPLLKNLMSLLGAKEWKRVMQIE